MQLDMGHSIVALEFDSEVLVNQAPVLKLANGKPSNLLDAVRYKTLLFVSKRRYWPKSYRS